MPDIDLDAIKARLAAVSEPLHPDARMEAYYYEFDRTGVAAVDAILSAVAVAGKGAHNTQDWIAADDYGYYDGRPGLPPSSGGSAASLIERTAVASAETVRALLADLTALVAENRRLRARICEHAKCPGGSLCCCDDRDIIQAENDRLRAVAEAADSYTKAESDFGVTEAHRAKAYKRLCIALDALDAGGEES